MLCPVDAIGNKKGESFIGKLKNLKIYDSGFGAERNWQFQITRMTKDSFSGTFYLAGTFNFHNNSLQLRAQSGIFI